jgi:hypothetical protein
MSKPILCATCGKRIVQVGYPKATFAHKSGKARDNGHQAFPASTVGDAHLTEVNDDKQTFCA